MVIKIIMLSILALIGVVAGKTGYLPENSGVFLSRVVIKVTTPILILTTMAGRKFTIEELKNGVWIYLLGLVFVLLSFAIASFACKWLKMETATKSVFKMHAMFGNVIYLAFPLIDALYGKSYGELAIAYAVFYNLANDTILWTLGIYLVNSHNTKKWKDNLKHMINGNTISFALGIILVLINFQGMVEHNSSLKNVYDLMYATLRPLGETTIPLSMLFIGLILSETKISGFKDVIKRYPSFILSVIKLVIMPFIAFFALKYIGGSLPHLCKGIIVIQLAMPGATIVPALAAQYESDYKFATENVFFTTLFSLITLPLIANLVK